MRRLPIVLLAWWLGAACAPRPGRLATTTRTPPSAVKQADSAPRRALTAPPLPPPVASAAPSDGLTDPVHVVAVQPGDIELQGGDSIEITEVRGTAPRLQAGSLYEVRGRYRLRSHARATLLFSVTTSGAGGVADLGPDSQTTVTQGDGTFTLRMRVISEGHPHVTFYDDDGRPFGGVYFGHDTWRLEHKSWRYQATP